MWTRCHALALSLVLVTAAAAAAAPEPADENARRLKAANLANDGNLAEAYELYRALALDPKTTANTVPHDLRDAVSLLRRLNREDETDGLLEAAIEAQAQNWRLLLGAAQSYLHDLRHHGFIVGGQFKRGDKHGGAGNAVNSYERDRVRVLQLLTMALPLAEQDPSRQERADFYQQFAYALLGSRGYRDAWRLQYRTDLSKLPDYAEGYGWEWAGDGGRQAQSFAPVDANGDPVFHQVPKSFAAAQTDGECWRYLLAMRMELDANCRPQVTREYADFLFGQFDVQTLADYGWYFRRGDADAGQREQGLLALHTLGDDETVARLATGIKRFKLPAAHNYLKLYQTLGDKDLHALQRLSQIYLDRRQYPQALPYLRKIVAGWPGKHNAGEAAQAQLDQITKAWGMFDGGKVQPAGRGATVDYRFRNGTRVTFVAHRVMVDKLLGDVKDYLKSNPRQLAEEQMDLSDIGARLVYHHQAQYVGGKEAEWSLEVVPRPHHFDKRVTVATPLQKAGVYLIEARMQGGNTSRILVWLADTVLSQKPVNGNTWYYVADAVSGQPVAGAQLEFFGYHQEYVGDRITSKVIGREYQIHTKSFAKTTDATGQALATPQDTTEPNRSYTWLVTARKDGRLAFLGFEGLWSSGYNHQVYGEQKTYAITDRPVYRPGQTVRFKSWVSQARYDIDDTSRYAGQHFSVLIHNPKGEQAFEKTYQLDEYGGLAGEYVIPKDATLGVYNLGLPNTSGGGLSFRVEEYKKPEFEVTVEAPTEPVMLGEVVPVKVNAKYYFGAPVVNAKVKLKVERTDYAANWYPAGRWDWFYGPGYWWFGYDYDWYPGWRFWGCAAPWPWWYPQATKPPELVLQQEAFIGPDGKLEVKLDTRAAKEMYGDTDHRYQITAEVTDESRRTIVGGGQVLVAREPFRVYVWVDRGYYNTGDTIAADAFAQTLDSKPVAGNAELRLLKVSYDAKGTPQETAVRTETVKLDADGRTSLRLNAGEPGQFRLSCKVTDAKGHTIEGGYIFVVRGPAFGGGEFRYSKLELVPDQREYAPGAKVKLMINTDQRDATVMLFLRPCNGAYQAPQAIALKGKSALVEIEVGKGDMPNFFVEALTVYGGEAHTVTREIVVPPEKRVLDVKVTPSATEYKPGEKAKVKVQLTDFTGAPFVGAVVMSIYDKAVEYIAGGPNVAEIKAFFWKWRRSHSPQLVTSLQRGFDQLLKEHEIGMAFLGVFGAEAAETGAGGEAEDTLGGAGASRETKGLAYPTKRSLSLARGRGDARMAKMELADATAPAAAAEMSMADVATKDEAAGPGAAAAALVTPTVRQNFADTAYWNALLTTDAKGEAEIELTMPENLTGWKVRTWALGKGPRVGEATVEVVTRKNLMLRLQAPRFFVQTDEVTLSANIHNYLKSGKKVKAVLELEGGVLAPLENPAAAPANGIWSLTQDVEIAAGGEQRVDWQIRVTGEGQAIVRMKALTDEESDAMQMTFPAKVHGIMKTESYAGHLRPEGAQASLTFSVPEQRREAESRLEVRYSPTLAGAMVDALPYLVSYPYGCTEQTLNKFIPTVITQKILLDMGLDLKAIQAKRTNLNAQEIGDDPERAKQWRRHNVTEVDADGNPIWTDNPVFDADKVREMVNFGVTRLTNMQLTDGGWGWFSGWEEHSYPHTTATVVHGLQLARQNDVLVREDVLQRGVAWLTRYQDEQVYLLGRASAQKEPWKERADELDALIFMVLTDANVKNDKMQQYLCRDRAGLSVYGKCLLGMALHKLGVADEVAKIMRNLAQFLVRDAENQTAYLKLGNDNYWWYWYGSEFEAHAYYLKLLARVEPKGDTAPWLVKYLLNNRKHATYWNSTRDTAICVEAMGDFLRASGEGKPDMNLEVWLDGKKHKEVKIDQTNLFAFDNRFVLTGADVTTGKHTLELRRTGQGPLYFNAYLGYFSLEDHITKAGLEVKVERKYYRLVPVDASIKAAGSRGQALDQKVEKFARQELKNLDTVTSGDLLEIELLIASKNDYEYLVFEDLKAAGCEPYEVRSGYGGKGLPAYLELRDDRVSLFVRWLPRGEHSIAYRMRAEIPGKFSALPTLAYAMYAPELKGNSDEIKLRIKDAPAVRR